MILPDGGVDIPGPVDWENTSHYLKYDEDAFTVQTWGKTGPDYGFHLMTRIRPMSESEIIHVKLKGYSREAVLKAYGVSLEDLNKSLPVMTSGGMWGRFIKKFGKKI